MKYLLPPTILSDCHQKTQAILIRKELKVLTGTRVDVSETFSADQLWFRILSGLFQRCSLPENLWTALIQLWTALKTEICRAKNQRWIRAVSALIFSETELIFSETALKHQIFRAKNQHWIRAVSALIFSKTELNSADFLWNSAEKPKIQSKKSALNQRCFSVDFLWNRADNRWSLLKQLLSFLIFPWDNAEHSWILCFSILVLTGLFLQFFSRETSILRFLDIYILLLLGKNYNAFIFCQLMQSSNLTVSGNCDLIIFLQIFLL